MIEFSKVCIFQCKFRSHFGILQKITFANFTRGLWYTVTYLTVICLFFWNAPPPLISFPFFSFFFYKFHFHCDPYFILLTQLWIHGLITAYINIRKLLSWINLSVVSWVCLGSCKLETIIYIMFALGLKKDVCLPFFWPTQTFGKLHFYFFDSRICILIKSVEINNV